MAERNSDIYIGSWVFVFAPFVVELLLTLSSLFFTSVTVDSFKQFCNRSRDPPCVTGQLGLLDRRAKEEGWSGGQETKAGGGSSEKRTRGTSHALHGPLHSGHLSMQTTPCLTTSVLRLHLARPPLYWDQITSSFRLSLQPVCVVLACSGVVFGGLQFNVLVSMLSATCHLTLWHVTCYVISSHNGTLFVVAGEIENTFRSAVVGEGQSCYGGTWVRCQWETHSTTSTICCGKCISYILYCDCKWIMVRVDTLNKACIC